MHYDLAFVYKLKGNTGLCKETLLAALKIEPANKVALDLQKELEQVKD